MKKLILFVTTITLSVSGFSQLLYTFDSVKTTSGTTDPTPVPVGGPGVTCGSFTAVGTPANSLAAMRFAFANWPLGSTGGATDTLFSGMTEAISTSEYYEVTLTPGVGYTITGDSIKFGFERSGTGVRTYAVRSSLDGYATNLTAVYLPPNTNVDVQAGNIFFLKKDITTPQNRNVIVLGPSFVGLSSPVTFRFYGWNAEGAGGTFSIDNVTFIGSSVLTGISEKTTTAVSIFPNPSNDGVFSLNMDSNTKATISVFNIIGSKIFTKEISGGKQLIDLSSNANGSYFITIQTAKETITKKIIISK